MKRLCIFFITIVLLVCFSACASESKPTKNTESTETTQTTSDLSTDEPEEFDEPETTKENSTIEEQHKTTTENSTVEEQHKTTTENSTVEEQHKATTGNNSSQSTDTGGKDSQMNTQTTQGSTKPDEERQPSSQNTNSSNETTKPSEPEVTPPAEEETSTAKTLIVYFSATGTTETLAEYAADILGADLYEITPQVPYTDEDLKYYSGGRADKEQDDPTARPAISGNVKNIAQYDTVLLGYPIWHGQAPRIISTFLESYDFSGKTILPFCTSHSSGIGSSDTNLHSLAPKAKWLDGKRFASSTSKEDIATWLENNGLHKSSTRQVGVFDFEKHTVLLNSGYEMPINGLGTYSLHGDTCINAVKYALSNGVRLIDTASAYGNEEEIGQAIREAIDEGIVKREDIFVITKIYPGSEMQNPEQSIQACIDRLNIGYVDMILLHHPDTNDVKAYKAIEKFVEQGKVRSIGLSNWYVEELTDFLPQVDTVPALIQNEIHPYYQENDVIPFIQEKGIVVQGWYPLGGRGHTTELLNDSVISEIACIHGVSSAQVILRWNLQKGVVVIPGSSNPSHIKENTELYHFTLTEDEMNQINALDRNEKHDWY